MDATFHCLLPKNGTKSDQILTGEQSEPRKILHPDLILSRKFCEICGAAGGKKEREVATKRNESLPNPKAQWEMVAKIFRRGGVRSFQMVGGVDGHSAVAQEGVVYDSVRALVVDSRDPPTALPPVTQRGR